MKVARTRVPKQCEFDAMVGANLQYIRKFRKLSMAKVGEQVPDFHRISVISLS